MLRSFIKRKPKTIDDLPSNLNLDLSGTLIDLTVEMPREIITTDILMDFAGEQTNETTKEETLIDLTEEPSGVEEGHQMNERICDDNECECVLVETTDDILSVNYWKNTKTFKTIKDKETQFKYYKKMKSCDEVLQLVDLESKPFGAESEKIIVEIFKLGPRTSSQNDGTRHGKKIEIKSARYWAGKDDCVWQHLEPDHDYEYALFTLLDFHGWKVWIIKKSFLMGEMREKKIVTFQGKQGWWVKKSAILPYLTPINTIAELDTFIQS